jgi:hypothetical protein
MSSVYFEIHSDPISLGRTTTDSAGSFSTELVVPVGIPFGQHQLFVSGLDNTSKSVTVVKAITVTQRSENSTIPTTLATTVPATSFGRTAPESLAFTGVSLEPLVIFAVVLVALGVTIRRKAQRPANKR